MVDPSSEIDGGGIEAYLFERHIDVGGIDAIRKGLASSPGVRFVAQFVGAFNLFARVEARDLGQLQGRIANEYYRAGVRSDWSLNLTANSPNAPKRRSPDVCALVCAQTNDDPFDVYNALNERFEPDGDFAVAVVTGANFDLLIDLGAPTIDEVITRVRSLRAVDGIGRTSTALADLADNAIRPPQ